MVFYCSSANCFCSSAISWAINCISNCLISVIFCRISARVAGAESFGSTAPPAAETHAPLTHVSPPAHRKLSLIQSVPAALQTLQPEIFSGVQIRSSDTIFGTTHAPFSQISPVAEQSTTSVQTGLTMQVSLAQSPVIIFFWIVWLLQR